MGSILERADKYQRQLLVLSISATVIFFFVAYFLKASESLIFLFLFVQLILVLLINYRKVRYLEYARKDIFPYISLIVGGFYLFGTINLFSFEVLLEALFTFIVIPAIYLGPPLVIWYLFLRKANPLLVQIMVFILSLGIVYDFIPTNLFFTTFIDSMTFSEMIISFLLTTPVLVVVKSYTSGLSAFDKNISILLCLATWYFLLAYVFFVGSLG